MSRGGLEPPTIGSSLSRLRVTNIVVAIALSYRTSSRLVVSSRRTQPRSWGCDAGLDCEQEKTYIQVTPPLRFLRGARNRREAVSACLEGSLRTIAYGDGSNLYYRALRGTPDKWLDVRALLELVYPRNALEHVRYYTALVKPLPNDPDQPRRQQTYLRALSTLPGLTIHLGQFTTHEVRLPLVSSLGSSRPRFARVLRTEEKGSDVNLAAHLVEPIRLVTRDLGLPVGVLTPCNQPAGGLRNAATFYTVMRANAPAKCQLPP